jgi:hypothetical protein
MPVILAIREAESVGTWFEANRGEIVWETHSPNNQIKMDWRCGSK